MMRGNMFFFFFSDAKSSLSSASCSCKSTAKITPIRTSLKKKKTKENKIIYIETLIINHTLSSQTTYYYSRRVQIKNRSPGTTGSPKKTKISLGDPLYFFFFLLFNQKVGTTPYCASVIKAAVDTELKRLSTSDSIISVRFANRPLILGRVSA